MNIKRLLKFHSPKLNETFSFALFHIFFSPPPPHYHPCGLSNKTISKSLICSRMLACISIGFPFLCVCSIHCIIIINAAILPKAFSENTRMIMTFSFLFFCHDIYCLDFTMISMEYTRRFMVTTMLKPILVQCSHCVYKCTNKIFSFTNHINIMYDTIRW